MGTESLGNRIPIVGLESPFGKARSMTFPRTVLAGHGVLSELGTCCRQFDFPTRGAVVTGAGTSTGFSSRDTSFSPELELGEPA